MHSCVSGRLLINSEIYTARKPTLYFTNQLPLNVIILLCKKRGDV